MSGVHINPLPPGSWKKHRVKRGKTKGLKARAPKLKGKAKQEKQSESWLFDLALFALNAFIWGALITYLTLRINSVR